MFLSSKEKAFLDNSAAPDTQVLANMSWRAEALNVLAWVLGLYDSLQDAKTTVETSDLAATLTKFSEARVEAVKPALRSTVEILDALDLTYRLHWTTEDARLTGDSTPEVSADIISERHYALNRLTGFNNTPGTAWDDIDTPT